MSDGGRAKQTVGVKTRTRRAELFGKEERSLLHVAIFNFTVKHLKIHLVLRRFAEDERV